MKLQSFGVIFALIVIPLILVLTYYIQLQVDTIELQTEYDTHLLAATHDAMSSFELNTANEDLSSVSDSLRTIIEASSNIFINTLATKMGMSNASKSYIEPYIPALLYTLYDGYYIYAPTKVLTTLTDSDGNAVYVGDLGVKRESHDTYSYTELDEETLSESEKAANRLTYSSLEDNVEDYGQLLYLKKGSKDRYTANIAEAELKTKNVLKTYMPYSARYQKETNAAGKKVDMTVVYTLDNYITVEGSIGDEYYAKSGYLIPYDSVKIEIDGVNEDQLLRYNQNDAQEILEESGRKISVKISDGTVFQAGGNNIKVSIYNNEIISLKNQLEKAQKDLVLYSKGAITEETYVSDLRTITGVLNSLQVPIKTYSYNEGDNPIDVLNQVEKDCMAEINNRQYELDKISSAVYYLKAKIFSKWISEYLGDIEEKDLIEISGQEYTSIKGTETVIHDFENSNLKIFNVEGNESNGITEIDIDSPYYTHKLNVMRNSIQYNLNLTLSTYNKNEIYQFDYEMPVISNQEWDQILSKVSIVSFMQGFKCRLKTYNNYRIVSSINNEIAISPDNIYYVSKNEFNDENSEYHRLDCEKLIESDVSANKEYRAFTSKEVKYDKLYDKSNTEIPYSYDHKNLACYQCINDINYKHTNIFDSMLSEYATYSNLRKAFYIAVGKERNNVYKMNAIDISAGFEVIFDQKADISNPAKNSTLTLDKVKEIEIVIGTINTTDRNETTVSYAVNLGGTLNNETYSVPTNSTKDYTIRVSVDPNKSDLNYSRKVSLANLYFTNLSGISTVTYKDTVPEGDRKTDFAEKNNDVVKRAIKYVRVIYK